MEPINLQPMTAGAAATGMKKSSGGKFTRRILKRVFHRSKLTTHAEVNEDNDSSGFDIVCVGEQLPTHPNPIIHPLKSDEKLRPRFDAYLPTIGEGRRKSSASDYLTSVNGDVSAVHDEHTIPNVNLDDFPSTPTGFNKREAHISDALDHLIGVARSSDERNPPRIASIERRARAVPQQSAESTAKDYMRHRRMRTRNSMVMRNASRRSGHGRRLSNDQSSEREDSMLLAIQTDRYRMAKELPKPVINLSLLRTRSQVVDAAIPNENRTFRIEWDIYLKDYCAGRFNIISPPKPPRRHTTFTYLPALSPHNEDERIAALARLNPEWSRVQEAEGMKMIRTAQGEFRASGAAISLVISNVEILKVQVGYELEAIKRSESIAAHALLSTEVLVVLDTQKDWRFAGNPLVTQNPKIRFFAGAPMMTCSGAVIGVFAIFGYEPREEFTAAQRRRLTDFAAVTMSDIMPRSKNSPLPPPPLVVRPVTPSPHFQPTPPASFDMGSQTTHPAFREGFKLEDSDSIATPKRRLETPDFIGNIQNWNAGIPTPGRPGPDLQLTPPSTGSEESLIQPRPGFGKNHKDLFLAMHHPNLTFRERQPNGAGVGSPVLRSWTPRPFSGSDLTSLGGREHPSTPFDAAFFNDDARSRVDDESYFDRSSAIDRSFVYEKDKARLIVEHTANQDASKFYRTEWPESPTEETFERPASRPLLDYDDPPEERGLA